MIKLNNKKITYVALADTNNSIKAPKEIWYADSSNSVKLVYRRKDALIEGEDYEKYHWLDGDGTAHINTLITIPNETVSVKTKIINTSNVYQQGKHSAIPFSNMEGYSSPPYVGLIQRRDLGIIYNDIYYPRTEINYSVGDILDVDMTTSRAQIGEATLCIFDNNSVNFIGEKTIWDGKISNFEVESLESAFKISLVPCKLLKPVPKWLDANGIRRQVGECGMIDLVSGKFYGNVNSVGTFTVENYYERKEWLVGDGSAYINTKVTSYTGTISTKYNFIESEIINNESAILGRERVDYTIADFSSRLVFLLRKSSGRLELQGSDTNVSFIQYLTTDTINVDVVNNTFTTSTQSGSVNIGDNVVGRNLYLFATNSGSKAARLFHGKIAYLKIPNKLNLIPCTLTMDLPASMDANNIARTKGTSGMWDLVSDKFYGNVANSGTFKAVNLAEGVDYEVYDWLVGDGKAYIDTLHNLNEDLEIQTKCVLPTYGTYLFWYREGVTYQTMAVWNIITFDSGRLRFANSSTSARLTAEQSNTYELDTNGSTLQINGVLYTVTKNPINRDFYLFRAKIEEPSMPELQNDYTTNGVKCAYFRFKDTNSITIQNLIPVKLLRSIPSKYDANGIARNAGECGMYDTVNDVFYGNVANSGTFSVSDDE